jgi:hypothetical protein
MQPLPLLKIRLLQSAVRWRSGAPNGPGIILVGSSSREKPESLQLTFG